MWLRNHSTQKLLQQVSQDSKSFWSRFISVDWRHDEKSKLIESPWGWVSCKYSHWLSNQRNLVCLLLSKEISTDLWVWDHQMKLWFESFHSLLEWQSLYCPLCICSPKLTVFYSLHNVLEELMTPSFELTWFLASFLTFLPLITKPCSDPTHCSLCDDQIPSYYS